MAVFSKKPGASPPPLWATLREIVKWLFYWTYYDFESFQNRNQLRKRGPNLEQYLASTQPKKELTETMSATSAGCQFDWEGRAGKSFALRLGDGERTA
jgi:hypothetical protein